MASSATGQRRVGLNVVDEATLRRPKWRANLWAFADEPTSSRYAKWFSIVMLTLIALSTVSFVVETVKSIKAAIGTDAFFTVEAVCIIGFTIEVALRVISTPDQKKFWSELFTWIDVIAIIPFYVELGLPSATGASSLGVLRVMRLVRVARVVKVSRYSTSIRIFTQAMLSSVRPLLMLFFLVSIAMVMFSSGVYYAELTSDGCRKLWGWETEEGRYCNDGLDGWVQVSSDGTFTDPEGATVECICRNPNPFTSIPATFWWCLVTMTTVGYGDHVPVTDLGRLVAVATMISGIIILALPITVIGTNFARVLREIQHEKMLAELNTLDHNDDGVVDKKELKQMLKTLAGLADGKHRKLVPTDADELIGRYDLDDNGVLDAYEMSKLKKDLAERLTQAHPAYRTLVESAEALRNIAESELAHEPHVKEDLLKIAREVVPAAVGAASFYSYNAGMMGTGLEAPAVARATASASATPAARAAAVAAATPGMFDTGDEDDDDDDGGVGDSKATPLPKFGAGVTPATALAPISLPTAVQSRLNLMETHINLKMAHVVDLLQKMNRAVTSKQTEPLM